MDIQQIANILDHSGIPKLEEIATRFEIDIIEDVVSGSIFMTEDAIDLDEMPEKISFRKFLLESNIRFGKISVRRIKEIKALLLKVHNLPQQNEVHYATYCRIPKTADELLRWELFDLYRHTNLVMAAIAGQIKGGHKQVFILSLLQVSPSQIINKSGVGKNTLLEVIKRVDEVLEQNPHVEMPEFWYDWIDAVNQLPDKKPARKKY